VSRLGPMLQVRGLLLATATDFARRQHLHHHCAQHDPSMTGKHQDQPVLPRTFLEIMESCGFSQLPEVTQKSSLEVQFSVASPPTSITVLFGACRRFWSNQSFAMHMTTKGLQFSNLHNVSIAQCRDKQGSTKSRNSMRSDKTMNTVFAWSKLV